MHTGSEILRYLAYFFIIAASLIRGGGFYFRVLLIVGALSGMLSIWLNTAPTLWIDIALLGAIIIINLSQILMTVDKNVLNFRNEDEKTLYELGFQHFTIPQFRKLIKIGKFLKADAGDILTEEGKPVLHLRLICKGQARIVVNGQTIAYCHPGNLIGEMSFITHAPASATVYVVEPTNFIQWPQDALRELLHSDKDLHQAMQGVFNADFLRKHTPGSSHKMPTKTV